MFKHGVQSRENVVTDDGTVGRSKDHITAKKVNATVEKPEDSGTAEKLRDDDTAKESEHGKTTAKSKIGIKDIDDKVKKR